MVHVEMMGSKLALECSKGTYGFRNHSWITVLYDAMFGARLVTWYDGSYVVIAEIW